MKKHIILLGVVVLLVLLYFFAVEHLNIGVPTNFNLGGRDNHFSLFDLTIILISVVAAVLVIISLLAYNRKPDKKMLFVSLAFLLFTIKGILNFLDNFIIRQYATIAIAMQILDLLILVVFLLLLFKKFR